MHQRLDCMDGPRRLLVLEDKRLSTSSYHSLVELLPWGVRLRELGSMVLCFL